MLKEKAKKGLYIFPELEIIEESVQNIICQSTNVGLDSLVSTDGEW